MLRDIVVFDRENLTAGFQSMVDKDEYVLGVSNENPKDCSFYKLSFDNQNLPDCVFNVDSENLSLNYWGEGMTGKLFQSLCKIIKERKHK